MALNLHLARKVGGAVGTRTLDLSIGGARVVSTRPLRIFEELQFDLDLSDEGRHVNGTARVLRQDRHDLYALRFEHLSQEELDDLRAFVDLMLDAPTG